MSKRKKPQIWSINKLLSEKLSIPNYQRPYKWTTKNIVDLILDIQQSIEESRKYPNFKYRVGSIILHKSESGKYEIVDGQQRLLSFLLLKLSLDADYKCELLETTRFKNKETQHNLHKNYITLREWLSSASEDTKNEVKKALKDTLEVVVFIVTEQSEAFQLFDSQNSRGRALYPHDLLKAYHLREIHDKYDMQRAVLKWESKDPKAIRELFDLYLYPLWNWAKRHKAGRFTAAEIGLYKGIEDDSNYTYARRANKAMPYFQLTEPFISGIDFFEMVDHYMQMLYNIKQELITNPELEDIKKTLVADSSRATDPTSPEELDRVCSTLGTGLQYAQKLFFCALLCYYDRFHNFDPMAIKKLFTWAMMIRVDMEKLSFGTINKYAIGDGDNDKYSNNLEVFSLITSARRHTEISGMYIRLIWDEKRDNKRWKGLYNNLRKINGYDTRA